MAKIISFPDSSPIPAAAPTTAQVAADKRQKTMAVLRRLRAGQNLCKIGLAEGIGWQKLTEILYEFMDWSRVNAYICGNRRVA